MFNFKCWLKIKAVIASVKPETIMILSVRSARYSLFSETFVCRHYEECNDEVISFLIFHYQFSINIKRLPRRSAPRRDGNNNVEFLILNVRRPFLLKNPKVNYTSHPESDHLIYNIEKVSRFNLIL